MIVHQAKLIANVIASVLSEEDDIHVVATAVSPAESLEKLTLSNCNMILASATLPENGALALTKSVANSFPEVKVLIIGITDSKHTIMQYVTAGAVGYVLEDAPLDELFENLRAASSDKALVSPRIAAALMNQVAELAKLSARTNLDAWAISELTPREREVLQLIGEGLTNQEIADRLVIVEGTVKNHVHNILQKLEVSSRHEAASYLPILDADDEATSV